MRFPTSLTPGGDEYGHLAIIVSDAKYQCIIQDQAFTYQVPEKPTPFDNTIAKNTGEVVRQCRLMEHVRKVEEFERFKGVEAGLKNRIIYEVDKQYLRPLK